MLYCTRCGQCIHINEEPFIAWTRVSGMEKQYINPENGEVEDSNGMEDSEYGDSEYECPHCQSSNIEFDYNCEAEEAFDQRAHYERERRKQMAENERQALRNKIKDSDWDLSTNEVHK